MFSQLGDKLQDIFKDLRGHGSITEVNVNDAMRQVRLAQGKETERVDRLWMLTDGGTPERSITALPTVAPRSVAGTSLSAPP